MRNVFLTFIICSALLGLGYLLQLHQRIDYMNELLAAASQVQAENMEPPNAQ